MAAAAPGDTWHLPPRWEAASRAGGGPRITLQVVTDRVAPAGPDGQRAQELLEQLHQKKLRQQGIDPATHKPMAAADTASRPRRHCRTRKRMTPRSEAAAGFNPFPVCADYGSRFVEDLSGANAAALYGQFGGGMECPDDDAGFGAGDYSYVLDVSENLGCGETSSNSSN
ncbi:hypothetical protein VPH35_016694 [Triticum aestivum]|uniref:Uncharacterized protein n=1 Tax=Aegilops tauschii TaxID=37682 RepID=M8BBW9_AEGTA